MSIHSIMNISRECIFFLAEPNTGNDHAESSTFIQSERVLFKHKFIFDYTGFLCF